MNQALQFDAVFAQAVWDAEIQGYEVARVLLGPDLQDLWHRQTGPLQHAMGIPWFGKLPETYASRPIAPMTCQGLAVITKQTPA